jgi:hypothetical protein
MWFSVIKEYLGIFLLILLLVLYSHLIIPYLRKRRKSITRQIDETLFKEYTFEEWSHLTFNQKRDIWNHFWNRYDNEKGIKTRQNIINAFKEAYPELNKLSIEIGFGYFGWDVGMIYVILEGSLIRVPSKFSDIHINKGKIKSKVNSKEIIVSWKRHGGSGNFHLDSKTDHTL